MRPIPRQSSGALPPSATTFTLTRRHDIAVQLDRNVELAKPLERLGELQLPAIDVEALGRSASAMSAAVTEP